ncbi:MAG: dihydrolipoamide acetyltransferase family protein [Firmicutes bacterium]|nr:dihydrolipoamide acetyltransferase family protein [Bacillota bacterium]
MGVYSFRFPELGEGLHEGRVEKWLVKPGDEVKEDDAIAEVENDKAMVEVPSPVTGKVLEISVAAGATAVVGDPFISFEVAGAGNTDAALKADVKDSAVSQAGLGVTAHNVASAKVGTAVPAGAATVESGVVAANAPAPAVAQALQSAAQEVLATPGVRKFARESGVLITQVVGTGSGGKITRADIEAFLQGSRQSVPDSTAGGAMSDTVIAPVAKSQPGAQTEFSNGSANEERVPLTSIRKIIAQAMAKSKYTAPHVTLMDEVNVSELVKLRAEIKPLAAERGIKITYLPFIVKALVAAIKRYPQLNATLDEERQELVIKRSYHIGIATDTERGLLVPVVRDANARNMWEIASTIEDLATRGRAGKLGPAELKGSTISITNIGSAGGMFFTPIINYPEVAILGVGRITEKPIVQGGQIVPAHMMALSLSFDHRIIDGALGQNFVNEIKKLLENPRLLLLEV